MPSFSNILIFQPAAIGDVMLATPVAKTLKHNYPQSKITFWGHPSLEDLLMELCPYIDHYIDYERQTGLISMLKTFWAIRSDLFVDLSNSRRGMFMSAFAPAQTRSVTYKKQSQNHAVDNFLATVKPVCQEIPVPLFPTLFPQTMPDKTVTNLLAAQSSKILIGIVPGVGQLRPHRGWTLEGWHYLLTALIERADCFPILIGGKDERELGEKLAQQYPNQCLNLAGKLELTQTAALLKACRVVVSGDTGPAHIAVAVGTPVIGLYGPTYPKRSGPYGDNNLTIDQSSHCQCHRLKFCSLTNKNEPGECMHRIMLPDVLGKVSQVLGLGNEKNVV